MQRDLSSLNMSCEWKIVQKRYFSLWRQRQRYFGVHDTRPVAVTVSLMEPEESVDECSAAAHIEVTSALCPSTSVI